MMDQYREQYVKETEQIHAPAALIAKTKAAMRGEEARLRQESAVQTTRTETDEMSAVSEPTTVFAGHRKFARHFAARKWAYPLTTAAALLILVSVSIMMRGMKSQNRDSGGAVYEEIAEERKMESEEMLVGGDLDGGMAEAGAVMDSEGAAETTEEASVDETMSAEMEMSVAEEEDLPEPAAAEDIVSEEPMTAEDTAAQKSESKETKRDGQQRKLSDAKEGREEAETTPAEKEALSGGAADTENITIEKVGKKPDFCKDSDTETLVFKEEIFQVTREGNGWAAYVEAKDGGRYVIRGEAEDVETFLEAGYRELMEQREN